MSFVVLIIISKRKMSVETLYMFPKRAVRVWVARGVKREACLRWGAFQFVVMDWIVRKY